MELFECELPYFKTLRVTWTRGAVSFFHFREPHCHIAHIYTENLTYAYHILPQNENYFMWKILIIQYYSNEQKYLIKVSNSSYCDNKYLRCNYIVPIANCENKEFTLVTLFHDLLLQFTQFSYHQFTTSLP